MTAPDIPEDIRANWRHMSTAPRDGTRILLARKPNMGGPPMTKRVVIGRWVQRGAWSMEITANHYFAADHNLIGWQHLPELLEP